MPVDPRDLPAAGEALAVERERLRRSLLGGNAGVLGEFLQASLRLGMNLQARRLDDEAGSIYLDAVNHAGAASPATVDDPAVASIVASIHEDLGLLHRKHGRFADAREHLLAAVNARERAVATGTGTVASLARTLTSLGTVARKLGNHEEARRVLLGALDARARAATETGNQGAGENHHETGTILTSLGMLSMESGDKHAARGYFHDAVTALERIDGARHPEFVPELVEALNRLGIVENELGSLDAARACHARALALHEGMDERARRDHAPVAAMIRNNLGNVLKNAGDLEGAAAAFEASHATYKELARVDPVRHARYVKIAADNLGLLYREMHRPDKALALARDTLAFVQDAIASVDGEIRDVREALGPNAGKNREPAVQAKPGRNEPCPCGSGKKYKHCCLAAARKDGRA